MTQSGPLKKDHAAELLSNATRIVLKFGSALITAAPSPLQGFANEIAAIRARNTEVMVVSSGAVAFGRSMLGLTAPLKLEEKQAAAAAGQIRLVQAWQEALAEHQLTVAQILLTLEDTENRKRYLNATATLQTLLPLPVIPLINENDTTATSEIRYGDNDRLAAHTAQMTHADLLVLVSDIDGLYTADPGKTPGADHIPVVNTIDDDIFALAGDANIKAGVGSGGMVTKLIAARIANQAGIPVIICDGQGNAPLSAIQNGTARSTVFLPTIKTATARRQWIAGRQQSAGSVMIDKGAERALHQGSSLLAAGITQVTGMFRRGDLIDIISSEGKPLGAGLCAYDNDETQKIAGKRSEDIAAILGYSRRAIIIHRNDLALDG